MTAGGGTDADGAEYDVYVCRRGHDMRVPKNEDDEE
jgi:hypothetical protein